MKQINIMSSCDDNLALYIMPQLASINLNMPDCDIHFYLFHYRITAEKINLLKSYAKFLGNITFHEIIIENIDGFEQLTKHGGYFPAEAYVYLDCHDLLPKDIDRILYIDAGDIIIHGDISEYYFDDFEGKSFIISPTVVGVYESGGTVRLFNEDDVQDPKHADVLRSAYINSGCIVINLKKFRASDNDFMSRYLICADKIQKMNLEPLQDSKDVAYLGDQGILGLAFAGDVKIFGYDEIIKHHAHTWPFHSAKSHILNMYLVYNFTQSSCEMDDACGYAPIVLHYATPYSKPWKNRYTESELGKQAVKDKYKKYISEKVLSMHKIWWEYAALTPLAVSGSKPFGLNPERRDKNLPKINPLQFEAMNYLTYENYGEALVIINKLLETAAFDSDSFHMLWQMKVRAYMENAELSDRFCKSIKIIEEYIATATKNSYMHIYMHHYKGYCCQQLERYNEAISSYQESEALMRGYVHGMPGTEDLLLIPFDPTIILEGDWREQAKPHYPSASDDSRKRRIRVRTPLPNTNNAKRMTECYICLKEYDEAFVWANRVVLSHSNDVKTYFRLINESGQTDRVSELFTSIAKFLPYPGKHDIMDCCFETFNEIVLKHPKASDILAPFLDEYTKFSRDYEIRKMIDDKEIISAQLKDKQTIYGYKDEFIMDAIMRANNFFEASHLKKWFGADKFRTVFDIGANIGNHTVYFASYSPQAQVFAFEPIPMNYRLLEANIQVNGFSRKRIHLINNAVGSEKGYANMGLRSEGNNGTFAILRDEHKKTQQVEVVVIDELDLPVPDFVKIDVEGYEVEVLKGMKKTLERGNPLVWIEIIPETAVQVLELLDGLGYEIIDYWMGTSPHLDFLFGKKEQTHFPKSHLIKQIFEWNQFLFDVIQNCSPG